jgi:hypothetical protein
MYVILIRTHNTFRCVETETRRSEHETFEEAKAHIESVDPETYRFARLRYDNGKWINDASWEDGSRLWLPAEHRDGRPAIKEGKRPEHPVLAKLKACWGEAVRHVLTAKRFLGEDVGTVEVADAYLEENFPSLGSGADSLGRAAARLSRGEMYEPDWLVGFTEEERAVEVQW